MIHALEDLGYRVTIYETAPRRMRPDGLAGVEIVPGGPASLRSFLRVRGLADAVIVSRPHNMQYLKAAAGADLTGVGTGCIYDAEAIFAAREIGRREVAGMPMTETEQRAAIEAELALARGSAAVLVVSGEDRDRFLVVVPSPVFVVSHAVAAEPTRTPVERRRTILFVGAFGQQSPNDDAVEFFVEKSAAWTASARLRCAIGRCRRALTRTHEGQ